MTGACGPAQAFAEEFFYAWQYERPASPWLFALSALLVVVVMALCLFPLAPHWCRPILLVSVDRLVPACYSPSAASSRALSVLR